MAKCELIHFVKVLFCTASCSSAKEKNTITTKVMFYSSTSSEIFHFPVFLIRLIAIMTHQVIFLHLWEIHSRGFTIEYCTFSFMLKAREKIFTSTGELRVHMWHEQKHRHYIRNICQYSHYYIYAQHKQHECRFETKTHKYA